MSDTSAFSTNLPDATCERFGCPGCGEEVDVAMQVLGRLVRCPYCSTDFFASHEQSHLAVVDDSSPATEQADREIAFDKLRIKNYTALRMSAIRARSWWVIALCMLILVTVDMLGKAVIFLWVLRTWGIRPTVFVGVAAIAGMLARHAKRRTDEFQREIERSALPEPTTPPDFSTLSDGRDRWKDLENVR
jgi:hypothetical protein